jgi:hypothetical protein
MRTISIICLFISCLLFACNKDIFDSDGYYGTGTITMNTQTLTAKLRVVGDDRFCLPDTCINISVDSFSSDGILRTSCSIYGIPAKVGRYALKPDGVVGGSGQLKLVFSIYVGDGSALTACTPLKNLRETTSRSLITILQLAISKVFSQAGSFKTHFGFHLLCLFQIRSYLKMGTSKGK